MRQRELVQAVVEGLARDVYAQVADAAINLGMNVMGFDPHITVDAAWSLPAQVKRAASVNDVLRSAQFVSVHVPLLDSTRHLVNHANIGLMREGAVLLNFSREGIVADEALIDALAAKRLAAYVCDFPSAEVLDEAATRSNPLIFLVSTIFATAESCALAFVTLR